MAEALKSWAPSGEPVKIGRIWMWTMLGETGTIDKVLATCAKAQATDLVILANNPPSQEDISRLPARLDTVRTLTEQAQEAGMDVHWSVWLDDKAAYVNGIAMAMHDAGPAAGIKSLCLDAEGEYRTLKDADAEKFVVETIAPAFAEARYPIGVTSFAALPKDVSPLVAWAVKFHKGYGAPQSYAVFQNKQWQKNVWREIQPDRVGALGVERWEPVVGDRLQLILAVYGPTVPGRTFANETWSGPKWTAEESLQTSLERAVYDGVTDVGLWSEEWLSRNDASAQAFMRVLQSAEVTGKGFMQSGLSPGKIALGAGLVVGGFFALREAIRRWW